MSLVYLPDIRLNATLTGAQNGPPLVLLHGLGLDQRIWEGLSAGLSACRILSFDLRGHGASDCPEGRYTMGSLIRDTERLMDHFGMKDAVVIGHCLGGLIAQGLAVKRLDLVRGLVLTNTAAKIGYAPHWEEMIAKVLEGGTGALHDSMMERWLGRSWRASPALAAASAAFRSTRPEGWAGAAAAISGSDFYQTTATLRLSVLGLAGSHDAMTPTDLMRETLDLIPGHRFALIRNAGHIPMLEKPEDCLGPIRAFLQEIGHFQA